LTTNSIAKVALQFSSNAVFDSYSDNRETGSFILIDPDNNNTAAGGMIISKIDNVIPLDTKTDRKDILYRMPDDIAFKFTQTEFYKTNLEWIKTENEGGEP
jgi:sulfate adenylyltransferase subunit 1